MASTPSSVTCSLNRYTHMSLNSSQASHQCVAIFAHSSAHRTAWMELCSCFHCKTSTTFLWHSFTMNVAVWRSENNISTTGAHILWSCGFDDQCAVRAHSTGASDWKVHVAAESGLGQYHHTGYTGMWQRLLFFRRSEEQIQFRSPCSAKHCSCNAVCSTTHFLPERNLHDFPSQHLHCLPFQNVEVLKDPEAVKQLGNILKTNVRACKALGHPYVIQVSGERMVEFAED